MNDKILSLENKIDDLLSDLIGRYIYNPIDYNAVYRIIEITPFGAVYCKNKDNIVFLKNLIDIKDFYIK